jgi:hypothetical protein
MSDGDRGGAVRGSGGGRTTASIALAVLGAVLLLVGVIALYARSQIIDEDAFADRAAAALEDDGVRELVSQQIVVQLIERASTDVIAARPLVESVVDAVLDTEPFQRIFREAALHADRVLFVRERDNVTFDLSDAVKVVRFGLQSVSPDLAEQLPQKVDVALLALKKREFARQTLVVADNVRWLGIVLPLVALAGLIASVVVAPDRRVGVLRVAAGVAIVGAILAVALLILRERTLAGVYGDDQTTDAQVRAAIGGLLDAFFGDLFGWALVLGFGGALVAGAAAVLDPERAGSPYAWVRRRFIDRPQTGRGRALRGAAAILLGILVVLEPTLALEIVAVLGGAWLIFFGTGEVLLQLQRPGTAAAEGAPARRRTLATAGIVAAAVVAGGVIALLTLTSGAERPQAAAASPPGGCNGSRALCRLPLNRAVFAGTHNSFSAADSPGWFISNQPHTITRQLEDGIRLLLIDPHWGVDAGNGHVRTDFEAEGRERNKVAKALPPETLAAAERLAGRLGLGEEGGGEPEVYLCHTVCELGATKMVDALGEVRGFLDRNPGEVVILFIEPYVDPKTLAGVFEQADLSDELVTLDRDVPLPTLGELVASDQRVVVFTERDADGDPPWYLDGFSFIQDTPLGAKKVDELSCARNRGTADSPFLMLNQWADVFPPRAGANPPFQTRREILDRAHQCARRRGLPVDLIAVDHYDQGDLIPTVAELNRERIRARGRSARR